MKYLSLFLHFFITTIIILQLISSVLHIFSYINIEKNMKSEISKYKNYTFLRSVNVEKLIKFEKKQHILQTIFMVQDIFLGFAYNSLTNIFYKPIDYDNLPKLPFFHSFLKKKVERRTLKRILFNFFQFKIIFRLINPFILNSLTRKKIESLNFFMFGKYYLLSLFLSLFLSILFLILIFFGYLSKVHFSDFFFNLFFFLKVLALSFLISETHFDENVSNLEHYKTFTTNQKTTEKVDILISEESPFSTSNNIPFTSSTIFLKYIKLFNSENYSSYIIFLKKFLRKEIFLLNLIFVFLYYLFLTLLMKYHFKSKLFSETRNSKREAVFIYFCGFLFFNYILSIFKFSIMIFLNFYFEKDIKGLGTSLLKEYVDDPEEYWLNINDGLLFQFSGMIDHKLPLFKRLNNVKM